MTDASDLGDFQTHERLLWRGLSTLARNGFAAPPDDARDLIHDFYVEAWPGVVSRFDGSRATFATYLSAAFYKFARRRIVRLLNWRHRLVDLDLVAEHVASHDQPADIVEADQLIAFVRHALGRLPHQERSLLLEYLEGDSGTERALSRRFSMSRYAIRETLINAVGRLALDMGRLPTTRSLDAQVAHLLWHEGRSPRSAAAALGVSVPELDAAKSRLVASLLKALRGFERSHPQGRAVMNEFLQLLQAALTHPGDQTLLSRVQQHATEILRALDADEGFAIDLEEVTRRLENREWVSAVYGALAGAAAREEQETAIGRAMQQMRSDEAEEVGQAFAALIEGLGAHLTNWNERFGRLPKAERAVANFVANDASVRAAQPYPEALLRVALTPMVFHGATRALQLMFDRVRRATQGHADPRILEHWRSQEGHHVHRLDLGNGTSLSIPFETAVAQVGGTRNLPPSAAEPLTAWTYEVLTQRPLLVDGYAFNPVTSTFGSTAEHLSPGQVDLMARWGIR